MEFIGYALNLFKQSHPGLYKGCGKTDLARKLLTKEVSARKRKAVDKNNMKGVDGSLAALEVQELK